jgi:hypothetical protein
VTTMQVEQSCCILSQIFLLKRHDWVQFLFCNNSCVSSITIQELHLYNPEYVRRPHIVVLNKLDIPEVTN